jgi:hypothetical protein
MMFVCAQSITQFIVGYYRVSRYDACSILINSGIFDERKDFGGGGRFGGDWSHPSHSTDELSTKVSDQSSAPQITGVLRHYRELGVSGRFRCIAMGGEGGNG